MSTFQQYNVMPALTAVRLCSNANVSGVYFNGLTNNGVGATLTISASSLTVDSVVAAVGDRILLSNQTSANQNGIYVVQSIGTTVILQRSADMQSIEQIHAGFYVSIGAGSALNGSIFCVVEPIPAVLGINNMVWVDVNASTDIALPTIANHIAVYTNTAGALGEDASTAINGGNIQAGLSGTAGTVASFPGTASKGSLILAAVANTGNTNTTISNAAMGQASVISIPDPGVATSNFILADSAGTQSITTGNLTLTLGNLTVSAGTITATAGNITAGSSGHAGTLTSFPGTAANGSFIFAAVNNASNFASTLSNSAVGQATVYTLPDPAAATAQVIVGQSNAPVNKVSFTRVITAGFAALATAGKINVQVNTSGTSQFAVTDIKVLNSTGLSGGGGNRLLSVSDGTIVFNGSGITAALLGTPICTVWGGTGNPIASGTSQVSTAGANIFLQYTGGTTDYTAGSVQLAITLVQVTA